MKSSRGWWLKMIQPRSFPPFDDAQRVKKNMDEKISQRPNGLTAMRWNTMRLPANKEKKRIRKRKLLLSTISMSSTFCRSAFCAQVLWLLLNELLLQLIITDLKCNFILKLPKKGHKTHTMLSLKCCVVSNMDGNSRNVLNQMEKRITLARRTMYIHVLCGIMTLNSSSEYFRSIYTNTHTHTHEHHLFNPKSHLLHSP